jgi:fucose 4-O-acetylase-like acetyltransferase
MSKQINIGWIDILKGLGIISVVIGHIWPEEDVKLIYLIHMPLFFFVAGYLFKPTTDYKEFLIKKTVHLLVPYVCFMVIMVMPLAMPQLLGGSKSAFFAIKSMLFGGRYLKGAGTVFWFVTCFFVTQQLFNYIYTRFSTNILRVIMLVSLGLAYINSEFLPGYWLPWNVNVVLFTMPILYTGYLFKEYKKNIPVWMVLPMLIFTGLTIYNFQNEYSFALKSSYYGVPLLSLIGSLTIIYCLIELSKIFDKISFTSKTLSGFGKASMTIMYLHKAVKTGLSAIVPPNNLFIILVITLVITYIAHLIIVKFSLTRALLLGSDRDFNTLFKLRSTNQHITV